jgi:copper(I)-binding protein
MTTTTSLVRRGVLHTVATLALVGATIATPAHAHDFRAGPLLIDHPYATPSLAGTPNGAAYLRGIHNRGGSPDRLMAASTPLAERVELHEMSTEGDVMRMREVPAIDLPAGQKVQLRHGQRYHLMLINLRQPLKLGDRFDLTLKFEKAGETTVKAWVQKPRDSGGDGGHRH